MDFDVSKENIQPLRGGRNVAQLEVALQAQTNQDYQRELLQQREQFENQISSYTGDDPLDLWYNYISWMEQSYPKHGHEGNLMSLLEYCLGKFENDSRYSNDRRFCKLWIKYIDMQQNPLELYHMMYSRELCRGCAELYTAWAYYYEAAGDFQNAAHVFECGKRESLQLRQELEHAHQLLMMAAGRHMVYGRNEQDLVEKRRFLTSLLTDKPGRVNSVRTPAHGGTVILPVAVSNSRSNAPILIYQGDEVRGAEAAPISILTAAKRQEATKENTLKPGPWTKVPVKKRLATSAQRNTPSFTVHEDGDDNDVIISGEGDANRKFPPCTLEVYSDWVVSLILPEPKDPRMVPMYPKAKVYSIMNTEFSIEEIRASRYLVKKDRLHVAHDETNQAVQSILDNDMETSGPKETDEFDRVPPPFVRFDPQANFSSLAGSNQQMIDKSETQPHQSPLHSWNQQQKHSPARTEEEPSGSPCINIWDSPTPNRGDVSEFPIMVAPKNVAKFNIYEQSTALLNESVESKGTAMKTPFKDLNADELAETGSRGGMDVAAAAPVDSAKRLLYDEDSSSSNKNRENIAIVDLTCNTQMFNFNLNAMKVSTPQNKLELTQILVGDKNTRKQLFTESLKPDVEKNEKALSIIMEETKSYRSSSSSSNSGATKSSLMSNLTTKQTNMATISEEHNSYLAQNLMANAALRSSLLGDLMDLGPQHNSVVPMQSSPIDSLPSSPVRTIPLPAVVAPLDYVPSDPFKPAVINRLLQQVDFPGPHRRGYIALHSVPRMAVRKEAVTFGSDKYVIEKQLGKGTYGVVFRGIDLRSSNPVALKYQKPPNRWEFYICRELQSRLAEHPLRDRFMDVSIGYFSDQASIFITEFMPCGSLLDVANMVKLKLGRLMKESLCIYFCLEMLKVVQAMHDVKIIHADVKPDNFLVQLCPDGSVKLQLIDFGCSIDMSLFPPDASFTRCVTTEDFICCEMKDGRPWNYHTDLFCIAATAHVLLFEKYIQLQKREGQWSISQRLPRYLRLDLWNMFFSTLLNQQNGPADSVMLQCMLDESLKIKADDFDIDMRSLSNILRNR